MSILLPFEIALLATSLFVLMVDYFMCRSVWRGRAS